MSRSSRRAIPIALVLTALLLAGCGGDEPTNQLPTGLPSGFPTDLPTGLPSGAGFVTLTSGTASAEISNGSSIEVPVSSVGSTLTVATRVGTLTFDDGQGNAIAIAGVLNDGLTQTEDFTRALTVSVSIVHSDGIEVFASSSGECTVTFAQVDAAGVSGSFTCTGLDGGRGPADITGEFEASP